jgi:multidrug efflux pump subunit AcrB
MPHRSDTDYIEHERNTARFFVENRQISWVMLIAVVAGGIYGYMKMPKRKDPDIPVRVASVICTYPGATAQQVEQLVTRPIEETLAESQYIKPPVGADFGIKSLSMPSLAIVQVQLVDTLKDTKREFADINLKLNALNNNLPQGAGPIQFNSDFGDTAALMLTVASPLEDPSAIAVRANGIEEAIENVRAERRRSRGPGSPATIVYCFPPSIASSEVIRLFVLFIQQAEAGGYLRDPHIIQGPGFVGADVITTKDDATILAEGSDFLRRKIHESEIHPDAWPPAIIRDPKQTNAVLAAHPGTKYTYHQLDEFTDLLSRTIQGAAEVSRVDRSGVLGEQIFLNYSQDLLASTGLQLNDLKSILQARNITLPGGIVEADAQNILIDPSGEFTAPKEIGDTIVASSSFGAPVYLRDLVDISAGYQNPPRYLNFYTWKDAQGNWQRTRAVTLAVQMRPGGQIGQFAIDVEAKLDAARELLPKDLVIAKTSDQPRQVKENVDLFMNALYEAIGLVVLVSLIGFWEWRSAVLMAVAIPITLAMTFAFSYLLGIDIQQVSVATLIIALGLLVDDPVVAGDSIKRTLAEGHPPVIASWLGPTKLAHAIMFATVTNIVAYIPFLLLTGSTGEFLYSLPVVMTCALVASRLVSMTFIPLLGYYLLREPKKKEPTMEDRRSRGFSGMYYRVGRAAIEHRWIVFACSLLVLVAGWLFGHQLKSQFFPEDVQYMSYIDVWLPNDAPAYVTNQAAIQVEKVARATIEKYEHQHPDEAGETGHLLKQVTTFVGGGGPRFWFSVSPQLQQLNYAQVLIELTNKDATPELVGLLQQALSAGVPGVRADVRQLQTNPVEYPVEFRVTGTADVSPLEEQKDINVLRSITSQVEDILRATPNALRVRDDWDEPGFQVTLRVDPDRANLAGVTNSDVASSSTSAMNGWQVTSLRRGDEQIPVMARLRPDERAQLSDIESLYVYSSSTNVKVPLLQVSSIENEMQTLRIRHLEHFRTISVQCFPAAGILASQVYTAALPKINELRGALPPGYRIETSGEAAKTQQGFTNLAVVMLISVFLIFLALAFQFKHAVKPFLVFAATPYGVCGSLFALWLANSPFGFMAFLGIASLIGVIVSHVIVLFDFIEEMHEKGEPLEQALLDAGIVRLRPVMITVGATVLALFPLAIHGGPLWQPLCFAQIGGLAFATFVTLLLVPVLYSIFVMDLKIVEWIGSKQATQQTEGKLSRGRLR